jgi:hypothetical protein
MMLNKRERNKIYEGIAGRGLDPAEFDLEDTGNKVMITHNSGSTFEFSLTEEARDKIDFSTMAVVGTEIRRSYDMKVSVAEGINETDTTSTIDFVISNYIPSWLREIKATVGVPDYWAELKRSRESIAVIQRGDFANTPFTLTEQRQIAAQFEEVKKQVRELYGPFQ